MQMIYWHEKVFGLKPKHNAGYLKRQPIWSWICKKKSKQYMELIVLAPGASVRCTHFFYATHCPNSVN